MANDSHRIRKSLNIKPEAAPTLNEQGDIGYDTADDKLKVRGSSVTDSVVQEAKSQSLTNKTIDADLNTVSNIDNADIKAGAAIDRTKIASGTVDHVLINSGAGVLSSEAQLSPSRGGTGVANSANLTYGSDNITLATSGATSVTLPTTGTLATLAGSEALSNKTQIDVDNLRLDGNTISSTDTNGDVTVNPNGTGEINLEATVRTNDIDTPGAGTLTIGATDASTITIGNSSSVVNFNGTVNNNNVTNLNVTDKLITINDGGGAASGNDSGLEIEENGSITGYMKTSADRNSVNFKAPNTNGIASLTPGASNDVVTLNAATQTLSNKTLSDNLTLAEVATPSTPASGFGRVYFKSDGFLYQLHDSGTETKVGAGAGGINYITNADFESNADGYATYKDAAQSTPVDGTGGSPAVTFVRSVDDSLRGAALGLFNKPTGVSHQGEGFSYQFLIDEADAGKVLSISFDYLTSAAYTSGDLTVYIYDVANSVLIQPAGYTIEKVTGTSNKFIATFQTPINSVNYRLIFHVATAYTGGYTLQIDNVVVGPQIVQYGAPITDWVDYTPTGSWTSNTTYAGKYRRVGDSIEGEVRVTLTGLPNAANLNVSLPSGMFVDTNKLASLAAGDDNNIIGLGKATDAGTLNYLPLTMGVEVVTNLLNVQATSTSGTYGSKVVVSNTVPFAFNTGDSLTLRYCVPVVGMSSNVVVSNNTDTRVVAALYTTTQTTLIAQGATTILAASSATKQIDTHGTFNTSTGEFTVPVPGTYEAAGSVVLSDLGAATDAAVNIRIQKNSTTVLNINNRGVRINTVSGSGLVQCVAGDTLRIEVEQENATSTSRSITSGVGGANTNPNWVSFKRLSGPSAIAASESISCRYTRASSQNFPTTTYTVIDFDTKEFDSHGAVTTGGSWRFTAPISGVYSINCRAGLGGVSTAGEILLTLRKNGVDYAQSSRMELNAATFPGLVLATDVRLLAGEYVDVTLYHTNGVTRNNETIASANYISIKRSGNY